MTDAIQLERERGLLRVLVPVEQVLQDRVRNRNQPGDRAPAVGDRERLASGGPCNHFARGLLESSNADGRGHVRQCSTSGALEQP